MHDTDTQGGKQALLGQKVVDGGKCCQDDKSEERFGGEEVTDDLGVVSRE